MQIDGQIVKLEYVWIDGFRPWGLRSKVRVTRESEEAILRLNAGDRRYVPKWGFDGSSTNQASGIDSDCILAPVKVVPDPTEVNDFIVFCEVMNGDGTPHETNRRHFLVQITDAVESQDPWFGMEQEYTILDDGRPVGFPVSTNHYPRPQGIYYCSVGGDRTFGRGIADDHMNACIGAGLFITGTNAEVMPGQWEYQIGGPGQGPLEVSDQLWISRWLLLRIAEAYDVTVTFDPKPMLGDWNGAGCHTNFSTKAMREPDGIQHIETACEKIGKNIDKHLSVYGDGIAQRLTGEHETCSYQEFKWGIADRTASIRIPRQVATEGCGYLEDRRPNANCDPYDVTRVILESVCLSG